MQRDTVGRDAEISLKQAVREPRRPEIGAGRRTRGLIGEMQPATGACYSTVGAVASEKERGFCSLACTD